MGARLGARHHDRVKFTEVSDTAIPTPLDIRNKRVVITGATGFLGGYVLRSVREAGGIVVAVSDSNRRNSAHYALPGDVESYWFNNPEDLAPTVKLARQTSLCICMPQSQRSAPTMHCRVHLR